MAHPRRRARVAKQLEREIGQLLLLDPVLQSAVCPEKKAGVDDSVSAIASVSEVELSGDMSVAKIYISIFSDQQGRDTAMQGLLRLEGYTRKQVAHLMNLRLCPQIQFILDESIQRAEQVYALLDRVKLQNAGLIEPPPIAFEGQDAPMAPIRWIGGKPKAEVLRALNINTAGFAAKGELLEDADEIDDDVDDSDEDIDVEDDLDDEEDDDGFLDLSGEPQKKVPASVLAQREKGFFGFDSAVNEFNTLELEPTLRMLPEEMGYRNTSKDSAVPGARRRANLKKYKRRRR